MRHQAADGCQGATAQLAEVLRGKPQHPRLPPLCQLEPGGGGRPRFHGAAAGCHGVLRGGGGEGEEEEEGGGKGEEVEQLPAGRHER